MSPEQDQGSRLLVPGWRRYVLALSLGILSALALPPLYAVPLLWPGLAGLALLNFTARDMRIAAFEGWLFGLGWFGVGLYWIGYAFLVDAEQFAALMPVAVIGISVGMALYMAMASAAVNTLMRRGAGGPMVLVPVFAGCWTLSEWLRGILLTGFPWNPARDRLGAVARDDAASCLCRCAWRQFSDRMCVCSPCGVVRQTVVDPWTHVRATKNDGNGDEFIASVDVGYRRISVVCGRFIDA